jgi:hypothetical protein
VSLADSGHAIALDAREELLTLLREAAVAARGAGAHNLTQ